MKKGLEKLKQQWEENPLQVIFVATIVATATVQVARGYNDIHRARTWDREVQRRIMMQGMK